jgi:hypothetical protein
MLSVVVTDESFEWSPSHNDPWYHHTLAQYQQVLVRIRTMR